MGRWTEMSGIPKGYKKTDVGEIPNDWKAKELKSIGIFSKGRGISRSEVKEQGKPCLRYGEIYTIYDTVIYALKSFISDESVSTSKRLYPGDIIFAASGETSSEIAKNVTYLGEEEAYVGGDTIILTPKSQDSVFLSYFLNSYPIAKQKSKIGQGDAVVHIHISKLDKIIICIPSLTEQQTIAQVLSDMDALIQAQKELIAKKRDIKQGTMQELLSGRVRLPGYETKGWKHTDIGDIPDDWVVRELGDICEKIIGGGTPSRNNKIYWNGKIPWATVKDLSSFNFNSTQEYITEEGLRESSSTLIPAGTIILATRMLIGKPVIYNCSVAINQDLKALFLIKDYDKYYLLYYLNMKSNELIAASSGSTVLGLSIQDLKTINLISPSLLSEQQAIARVLSDMDDELETLEAELEKLNHMKRGMMQELLTGRIRLI